MSSAAGDTDVHEQHPVVSAQSGKTVLVTALFKKFMIWMHCWYPHGLDFVLPLHLHTYLQTVGCSRSQFVTLVKYSLKSLSMTFPCPVCKQSIGTDFRDPANPTLCSWSIFKLPWSLFFQLGTTWFFPRGKIFWEFLRKIPYSFSKLLESWEGRGNI